MSLEQFASLAEIIGLLLVFASLIYVARQLNQTTTMMRVSASGERLQRDTDIVNSIVHSREVAEFWMKGATEFQNLDEIDKQRLVFFERRAILHSPSVYPRVLENLQGFVSETVSGFHGGAIRHCRQCARLSQTERLTTFGHWRPLELFVFCGLKRPLSVKADIQSGRMSVKRPKAAVRLN
jgi:hypothetical protein